MSGGSYDYAFIKFDETADQLSRRAQTPLRKAFVKHLRKVAQAMRDIEWVDSGDLAEGEETDSIRKCLQNTDEASVIVTESKELYKQLHNVYGKRKR